MPAVRRVVTTAAAQPARVAAPAAKRPALALPTKMSVPSSNLGDYTWMIYGPKKIGKTSLAAQFPDALFFMFEPGAKSLSVYQVPVPRWEDFRAYIELLKADPNHGGFRTVVIDTGYEAYERCLECVCRENGIQHPGGQNDYGASWKKVSAEFRKRQSELLSLGLGFIVLCHDQMKTSESLAGQKFDQVVPNLTGQADSYYRASIDNVCYYHYRGKDRFLQLRGSDYVFAGVATQTGFKTPTGEQVYAVPMGITPVQGHANLLSAFQCKQKQTFRDETEKFTEEGIVKGIKRQLAIAAKKKK